MMKSTTDYQEITISADQVALSGNLTMIDNAKGIVIFSHGSGSSRFSPRNNMVAQFLQRKGFATLLFDLLSEEEDKIYDNRFDIDLLTSRLIAATKTIQSIPDTRELPIAYFGASTGAASALRAAATLGTQIKAVVSRGGRPDLAIPVLDQVHTPTLLIVGELDEMVISLNEKAYQKISGICEIKIISNASHLFSEAGKLEEAAEAALDWFKRFL